MKNTNQQINIFIAYSRTDNHFLQKIRTHLKFLERKKEIVIWYDGEIIAGSFWDNAIIDKLENADMVLLLVSADALASDYFHKKEMQKALERHAKKEALVIPVILKPCFWQDDLGDIQALPKDGKPIVKWRLKSDAYYNIARGVRESLELVKPLKANRLRREQQAYDSKIDSLEQELIATKNKKQKRSYIRAKKKLRF